MTAINVIQTNDAIYFFSDGAYIDAQTGNLSCAGQKVFTYPAARCAAGISGPAFLIDALNNIGTFSQRIENIVAEHERRLPEVLEIFEGPPLNFGIFIAGYSTKGERQFYSLTGKTTDTTFKFIRRDADAWHYDPTVKFDAIVATLGEEAALEFDRGFTERLSVVDPVRNGMIAIETQRATKVHDKSLAECGGSAFTVGSFVQMDVITKEKCESRILKIWKDEVGKPISPYTKFHRLIGFKANNDNDRGINTGSSSNVDVSKSATDGYVQPTKSPGSYTTQLSPALNYDSINIGGATVRVTFPAGSGGVTGKFLRITLVPPLTGANTNINKAYIGHKGTGAADFDGTQVQLKFGGNSGVNITAGGSAVVSDFVAYNYDNTKPLIVSFYHNATSDMRASNVPATGQQLYLKSGVDDAANTTASGYTTPSVYNASVSKIESATAVSNAMTLTTLSQTTDSNVSNARVLIEYDNVDSPTLNSDLTAEVTCDGGANWAPATLSLVTAHGQDGRSVVETALTACTAGTSFAARLKTANGKNVPIHGLHMEVK
jgi:hypothetical protein